MSKAERFRAWRKNPTQPTPTKPKAPLSLAREGWMGFPNSHAPHGELTTRHQAKWVAEPVKVEPKVTPQPSRTARKSALTSIAERWDERKLAERLKRR